MEIFGQRHLINQHFSYGGVQSIFLRINSGATRGSARFMVANPHREVLAFGVPSLRAVRSRQTGRMADAPVRLSNFFLVGIYHASPEVLTEIRAAGFNAVQSYGGNPDHLKKWPPSTAAWD